MKVNKIANQKAQIITPFKHFSAPIDVCPALTTQCSKHYHRGNKRFLTSQECLRLQGFTYNFKRVISHTQMYKQAGNSMSVNVVKEIVKQIFESTLFHHIE
jgi:DNA (cytosine-5)-methyltransferase 1